MRGALKHCGCCLKAYGGGIILNRPAWTTWLAACPTHPGAFTEIERMSIKRCYICEQNPTEARHLGNAGLLDGTACPICHRPTCRHHLVKVRWRWRNADHHLDSAFVCRECQRTYAHRDWDPLNRDWIS